MLSVLGKTNMTSTSSDGWHRYYHVMIGTKHFDIVKAIDEQDAVRQVEKRFGKSSEWNSILPYRAFLCADTP